MNNLREWSAGAVWAALLAISACVQETPLRSLAGAGDSPAAAPGAAGSPAARMSSAGGRSDAHSFERPGSTAASVHDRGTPVATAATAAGPAVRRVANPDCESESADPRTSCHQYRPATLAAR